MAGDAVIGAETPGVETPGREALASLGRLLRQGAATIVDVATDKSTIEALDRLAGPRWRIAAQAADVAVVAARAAVRGANSTDTDDARGGGDTDEPVRKGA